MAISGGIVVQIIKGGVVCPAALTHATTVICDLEPLLTDIGLFSPRS